MIQNEDDIARGAGLYGLGVFIILLLFVTFLSGCSCSSAPPPKKKLEPIVFKVPEVPFALGLLDFFKFHCNQNMVGEDEMFEYYECHAYSKRPLRIYNCLHISSEPIGLEHGIWHFKVKCGHSKYRYPQTLEDEDEGTIYYPGGNDPNDHSLRRK